MPFSVSDAAFALLRATLPEFLGSLAATVVTTAVAAVFRTARANRRRRRTESSPAQLPPAQE
ncbi:hypothetical protein ACF1DV_33845 [Streptomyces achromogenes]|uniref:hypothetical protein n=1 Tax=Streptomyces achromogenes TaxID=67255 RepID=UPI0036FA58AA